MTQKQYVQIEDAMMLVQLMLRGVDEAMRSEVMGLVERLLHQKAETLTTIPGHLRGISDDHLQIVISSRDFDQVRRYSGRDVTFLPVDGSAQGVTYDVRSRWRP